MLARGDVVAALVIRLQPHLVAPLQPLARHIDDRAQPDIFGVVRGQPAADRRLSFPHFEYAGGYHHPLLPHAALSAPGFAALLHSILLSLTPAIPESNWL